MKEVWKEVPGFSDYAVSNLGRVMRSNPSKTHPGVKILKQTVSSRGYNTCSFFKNGKYYRFAVHRLVCSVFHGPAPSAFHEAAHNNGLRHMNDASNVRWVTRRENEADKVRHGTVAKGIRHGRATKPECTARGERNNHARLTPSDVLTIRATSQIGDAEMAKQYGVTRATVNMIRSRKTWRHI
jgi:DNA-binding transcriptional regulator YiaG